MGMFGSRKNFPGMPPTGPGGPAPGQSPGQAPGQSPGQTDWQEMQRQAQAAAAAIRSGRGAGSADLAELIKNAQAAQQGAMQQMAATQPAAQTAMKTGNVRDLMGALGLTWNSDYAKRCNCEICGGPKLLPSPSAYVYCDYCGALADYDFRRACDSEQAPSQEFVNLANGMHQIRKAAKDAGDRDAYRDAQLKFYDAYVTNSPQAVSHRVKDPKYRDALVRYMAERSVLTDFDPAYADLAEQVSARARAFEWSGGMTSPKVSGRSFRPMVDVLAQQIARGMELERSAGMVDLDPDHAGDGVRRRMAASLLCQGYLSFLEPEDAKWLVEQWGLDGEYFKLEVPKDGQTFHCGVCGGEIMVLKGSKVVVCGQCGHSIDVGGGESPCKACGGMITFPVGEARINCPYCKVENERMSRY